MNKVFFKTDQNHPQIKAYKEAVEKGLSSHHVLPRDGEWIVKRAGSSRASGVFPTQSLAISHGREVSKNSNSELYIHGQDGRIREVING
ncbi:MAG: DUF2188 domain-containing protein [bacterium]